MESILNFDAEWFKIINELQLGILEPILVLFRNKFAWIPLYILIIGIAIFKWKRNAWLPILFMVITVGVSDLFSSQLIKKNVERKRPCQTMEVISRARCGSGYSFTSSHATNHMSLAVFWFMLFAKWKGKRWLFIFWALTIGFAQIFVGVHYPVDVMVGFLLGALIGGIVYQCYRRLSPKFVPS